MGKDKLICGMLAVSLAGNVYQEHSWKQKEAEYTAAIAGLQAELSRAREELAALKADLGQAKSELEAAKQAAAGPAPEAPDILEGVTIEEIARKIREDEEKRPSERRNFGRARRPRPRTDW